MPQVQGHVAPARDSQDVQGMIHIIINDFFDGNLAQQLPRHSVNLQYAV